jgi:hypothetical protein
LENHVASVHRQALEGPPAPGKRVQPIHEQDDGDDDDNNNNNTNNDGAYIGGIANPCSIFF